VAASNVSPGNLERRRRAPWEKGLRHALGFQKVNRDAAAPPFLPQAGRKAPRAVVLKRGNAAGEERPWVDTPQGASYDVP